MCAKCHRVCRTYVSEYFQFYVRRVRRIFFRDNTQSRTREIFFKHSQDGASHRGANDRCSQSARRALFSRSKRGPSSTAGVASSYPSSTRAAVSASRLKARTSLSPSSPPASMSSALRPQARARSLTALCNQWTRKRWLASWRLTPYARATKRSDSLRWRCGLVWRWAAPGAAAPRRCGV